MRLGAPSKPSSTGKYADSRTKNLTSLRHVRQHLVRSRHAALRKADDAVGIDEVDGAFDDQAVGAIKLPHLLIAVHQQGEREVELLAEGGVLLRVLRVDSEDRHAVGLGFLP